MKPAILFVLSFTLVFCTSALASSLNGSLRKRAASSIVTDGASLRGQSFDYLIVGGGTSGLAAAYELSKDASKRVLVIEAGGDPRRNDKVETYSTYREAFGNINLDWQTRTVPQTTGNGRRLKLHAGKGVGGTSNINGGIFSVPPFSQIDAFGQLGNPGWSWTTFLPSLKHFQNFLPPSPSQADEGMGYVAASHGSNGPVDVGYPTMQGDSQDNAFRASLKAQLNISSANDLGSGFVDGASFMASFGLPSNGRTRASSATAYLSPIETSRVNLVILINNRATKIVWQPNTISAQAAGVEYQSQRDAPKYQVKAKQVIVAAGALRSPKLLELSGVGNAKVLNKIGVKQVINLPGVGSNLIEQVKVQVYGGLPRSGTFAVERVNNVGAFLTLPQLMSNASAMRSYVESRVDSWAQEAYEAGVSPSKEGLLAVYKIMVDGIFRQKWPVAEYLNVAYDGGTIIETWNLLTFSRGYSHASVNSVWAKSEIDPRYFSTPIDMDIQVAALRGARKTFQGQAFKNVLTGADTRPGFDVVDQGRDGLYGDYGQWEKYSKEKFTSIWHLVGTCAMMPENLGGVVGPDFKVHQTSNVWVIDASVIPIPLSSHLASVVYGMATKAADIIRRA